MKRNLIYIFVVALTLILSGCGSNDIKDATSSGTSSGGSDSNTTIPTVPSVDNDYNFFNIPSSIVVDKASNEYPFSLQVIDKDLKGISGQNVTILAYDTNYGKITEQTVATDNNGFANFLYTSPISLLPIDGQTLPLTAIVEDDNGTVADSVNITLSFNASTTSPTQYKFYNAKNISVSEPLETQDISVALVDSNNIGIPGKEVTISMPELKYGTIAPAKVITNEAGYAVFTYTAPEKLEIGSTNVTFRYEDDNGNEISPATATISIQSGTIASSTYEFRYPTTPITITRADEVRTISVLVTDENGVGISNEILTASAPSFGSLNSSTAVTNDAGKAEFIYTAPPPSMFANNTTIITLRNINVADDTNVTIVTQQSVITSEYNLTNAQPITINYPGEQKEIAVQLVRGKFPVEGESVIAESIPREIGRIENVTATTGDDGFARFNFIAADKLPDYNATITFAHFTDTNGAETSTAVNITILEMPLYQFDNESNLTIKKPDEQIDLKAQLLYKGVPVSGKSVDMVGFDKKFGEVFNYEVQTDSSGYATFAYKAPNEELFNKINGNSQSFKIKFTEGAIEIETDVNVTFDRDYTPQVDLEKPVVILPEDGFNPLVINSNNKNVKIPVQVFLGGTPYTSGEVKVALPLDILGVDVGLFDAYTVPLDDKGIAVFEYNGPSNIIQTLSNSKIDNNDTSFTFYHTENNVTVGSELLVKFVVPENELFNRNYTLDVSTSGEFSIGIPYKTKGFDISLNAQDISGNSIPLDNEIITKITVTSENSTIAKILDGNVSVNTLELNNTNSFTLKSEKLSGLVPVRVVVEFINADGEPDMIETIINIKVDSGPPSAISISYVSTGQDSGRAKYVERLAISVTDEYGNRVNTQPNITLGAIVGYAVDGKEVQTGVNLDGYPVAKETNNTRRLFYGQDDIDDGNASGVLDGNITDGNVSKTYFSDNTLLMDKVFKYINAEGNNTDKLVIFGAGKNYEAMGKWDIERSANDNHTLILKDNYFGEFRSDLYYAVGHNYYQDQCRQDGREWIGTTDSETYQLDEEGTVTVDYKYDYHLTGKDALIWVNLDGIQPDTDKQTRIGEVVKHTLRGTGFTQVPTAGYSLKKGVTGVTVIFDIWHENAPERYRNGHFGWRVKEGSTCIIDAGTIVSTNQYDARSCIGGLGQAFVQMDISNPDPDADCTFDITGLVVSDEF